MAIPGSLWIDGTTLRLINSSGSEYYYTGDITANAPTKITLTSITANGLTITFGFAAQASIPFSNGSTILVSGVSPSAYNNTYIVANCTTTSVVVQSSINAGAMTVAGTVEYSIVPGSMWIDSLYLYYVDSTKNIRRLPVSSGSLQISPSGTLGGISGTGPYTGIISNMTSVAGAEPGTIINANGMSTGVVTVTAVLGSTAIQVSSTTALTAGTIYGIMALNPKPGSIWVEGNYLTWISSSGGAGSKMHGHSDVSHSDVAATSGSPYGNSPHGNITHSDVPYTYHSDGHSNTTGIPGVPFDDVHNNSPTVPHSDVAHSDSPFGDSPATPSTPHSDVAHANSPLPV